MSIPTCSSEKSQLIGTEFLEGSKRNFLAPKKHQIALMKHLAAFESRKTGQQAFLWCPYPFGSRPSRFKFGRRTSVKGD